MNISVFDIFKIGIGPSSSHTVGPMRAAKKFAERLGQEVAFSRTAAIRVDLYGSLAHTGQGHGTDLAVTLGLEGESPDTVDVDEAPRRVARVRERNRVALLGQHEVAFSIDKSIVFQRREKLPLHSNGMRFVALDEGGSSLFERVYYSVGGGFVVNQEGKPEALPGAASSGDITVPHPYESGADLLRLCSERGLSISTLMLENECAALPESEVRAQLLAIAEAMEACVERGCRREGILPGGLKVRRRAASIFRRLEAASRTDGDPLVVMDWVHLYALAVNEENAAGGRVVTAPTNGAAGIIPAVMLYYRRWVAPPAMASEARNEGTLRFLLTAAAIGILYKRNASISGAEVGCQGEVGVACSMAAGALAEVMGGTPAQVENAAEIGMEHNLGLTCDPIGGLVQVPCIERNAMGAAKAINAARLALQGDGTHKVSLDKVIATMRRTGADMSSKYKETARGGLAVNIIEC
jgi:L-serine dehydratase